MVSITPLAIKRRTNARIAASNPRVKSMEQRAHNRCIKAYSQEIFDHLLELESCTTMNPELIKSQPQISVEMRSVLFDFLMDVHNRLKLSNATFYLTINIIDRYCSLRIVRKDHFQLLGLTALWLASKFSDPKRRIPTIDFLRATCCNCYTKSLFVEMESHILKSLNWEVGSAGHDSFIDLVLRDRFMDFYRTETINSLRYGANYLCQLMQLYHKITFHFSVSQLALASVMIVSRTLKLPNAYEFQTVEDEAEKFKLEQLIDMILQILRSEPVPNSFKTRYFHQVSGSKIDPTLYNIYGYSNEIYNIQTPKTPLSSPLSSTKSSPATSRNLSLSSSSSCGISTRPSTFSLLTPPTSGSASPVNECYEKHQKHGHNKPRNRIFSIPNFIEEQENLEYSSSNHQDDYSHDSRKRSLEI